MPQLLNISQNSQMYAARRRPVNHKCGCGHKEMIVPPCGSGEMVWTCICGRPYKMTFAGSGGATTESIFVGV